MCSPKGTKIGVDYMFGVNLYSRDTHDAVYAACSSSWDNPSGDCQAALTNMGNQIGDVNMYNILGPCIIGDRATKRFNNQTVKFSRTPTHVYNKIFTSGGPEYDSQLFFFLLVPILTVSFVWFLCLASECIDGIAAGQYLNNLVVRSAIHVLGPDRIPHWTVCTGALNYTSNIQALYPEPYLTLIDNYRVLVYNGDHDACVPIIDNEAWTESLGLSVEQPWHPWLVNQQVAGYVTKYTSCCSLRFGVVEIIIELVVLFFFAGTTRILRLRPSRVLVTWCPRPDLLRLWPCSLVISPVRTCKGRSAFRCCLCLVDVQLWTHGNIYGMVCVHC
jgi:hypothetical protein